MKQNRHYVKPLTQVTSVRCEKGFCASEVVQEEKNNKVQISNQYDGSWDGTGNDIQVGWENSNTGN